MKLVLRILLFIIVLVLLYALFETIEKHPLLQEWSEHESSDVDDDDDDHDMDNDDDDDDIPLRTEIHDGVLVLRLSLQQQQVSGLITEPAQTLQIDLEDKTFASVLSVDELLAAREQYQLIKAELAIVQTALNASKRVYERLKVLNEEAANISKNKLDDARAQKALEESRVLKLKLELNSQKNTMQRKWGKILSHLALHKDADYFEDFLNQDKALLLMALKSEQLMPYGLDSVYISRSTSRMEAEPALVLSPAPNTDPVSQGESYFIQSSLKGLRPGMRLNVWIPKNTDSNEGVFIPDSAVVWHEGLPWAYVKSDDELFTRKALNNAIEIDAGWLVSENFEAGQQVLVQGAQQLLSEEFRSSIPDEDDDP